MIAHRREIRPPVKDNKSVFIFDLRSQFAGIVFYQCLPLCPKHLKNSEVNMKSFSPRIMYVDADEDSGKIIDKLILNADPTYDITLFSDKRTALYQVRTSTFDLYILDGLAYDVDLCVRIRHYHPETPILFITGDLRAGDRQLALEKGATDLLVKPDELGLVEDTVFRLLNWSAHTGQSRSYAE